MISSPDASNLRRFAGVSLSVSEGGEPAAEIPSAKPHRATALFRAVTHVLLLRRDLPHHSPAMGATCEGSPEKIALRVHNHIGGRA